ncbi:hypothetical protein D3C87_740280 [compost metagenome]
MKTQTLSKTNTKQRLIITFGIIALILAIPLVAMQFTNEVDWKLFDFIIMGTLLTLTGLAIELVTRKVKSAQWKFLICALILFILFLIWAELAVGIFGTPFAGS